MNTKLVLAAPCLAILAACGASTPDLTNEQQELVDAFEEFADAAPILSGVSANSVKLPAGRGAQATSVQELNAIDFAGSEVGAAVKTSEILPGLPGFKIEKVESVAGKDSTKITFPASTSMQTVVVGSINDWIDFVTSRSGGTRVDEGVIHTTHGRTFSSSSTEYELGTKSHTVGQVAFTENSRTVKASVEFSEIAGKEFFVVGATRVNEIEDGIDSYTTAEGNFSYTGQATVFAGDPAYTSDKATMIINFDDNEGTFSASDFAADAGYADKVISITTNVIVDNKEGTISSSSGKIIVEGVEKSVGLNGILAHNNDAVVGGIVASGSADGVVGGVFTLSKKTP